MIMAACLSRGLQLSDLDSMTLGQAVDYIITYNNSMETEEKKEQEDTVRDATQLDFALF